MKKFICKIISISLLFFGIIPLIVLVPIYILGQKESFSVPSKNILFLGDSRIETSLNDAILSRGLNIGSGSEHLFFSYHKAKRMLKDNPQIDTLILSYGPHSATTISENLRMDNILFPQRCKLIYFLPFTEYSKDLYSFLSLSNLMNYYYEAFTDITLFKDVMLHFVRRGDFGYKAIGKYQPLYYNKLVQDVENDFWNLKYTKDNFQCDTTLFSYKYLRKIEHLCIENNVKLILLNAPVYDYYQYINVKEFELFRQKYLSDIEYVDFGDVSLPDSCYNDIMHLNSTGANIFSNYLQQYGIQKDSINNYLEYKTINN